MSQKRPHPQQHTLVPAGNTIEISLDWLPAPIRLPEHTDDEFKTIKRRWCRNLTERWGHHDEWQIGRDPHVRGPADVTFANAMLRSSWCPGVFCHGQRTGGAFRYARIIAFDMDDGTPYADVRDWLASVDITPFISYHSPSSMPEHERFRVLLLLDSYVTSADAYSALVRYSIRHLFGDRCDRNCTDAARVYFPGREIIEVNEPSSCMFSIDDVLSAIEIRVRESDRHDNAARTMRKVRRDIGLELGIPGDGGLNSRIDGFAPHNDSILTLLGVNPSILDDGLNSQNGEKTPRNDSILTLLGADSPIAGTEALLGGDTAATQRSLHGSGDTTAAPMQSPMDSEGILIEIPSNGAQCPESGAIPPTQLPKPPASREVPEAPEPPQAGQGSQGRTTSAARPTYVRGFPGILTSRCRLAAEFEGGVNDDERMESSRPEFVAGGSRIAPCDAISGGGSPTAAPRDCHDPDVTGWLREPQLFGLMTNLAGIRGGRRWFLDTLRSHPQLYSSFNDGHWEARFRSHRTNHRRPQRCENFCRHTSTCHYADTIIDTIRRPSQLRVIERPETVPLEEARGLLQGLVRRLLADHQPGVDVLHAETGLGKTETYIREIARVGTPCIIAVPTHRLKAQISGRLQAAGVRCLATPEIPHLPGDLGTELEALYRVGDTDGARRWILDHQASVPELGQYVRDLDSALTSDGTVVTTHARLVQVLDRMGDSRPVIIDEDPLRCLRPTGSVPISDLRGLLGHMEDVGAAGAPALAEFIARLEALPPGTTMDTPPNLLHQVDPVPHLMAARVRSRVICLLGSQHVLVNGRNAPTAAHYCCGRDLPGNRRIILMSATVSEAIHSHLFGPAMRFHQIPLAEPVGRVIQTMARTYSRTDIERRGVPDLPEGYMVIGFKANMDDLGEDAIGHYGAIEGLDDYGGRDIAVVGTPHMREETYTLLACALGRTGRGMEALSYRTVQHGGMEFRFMAYGDELLRTIQFHLIESELEQAVGRARVLTEDCTVRVYSNFPLRRARYEV